MNTSRIGSMASKLIAILLIVICVAVGAVGLIVPFIPGLLFLAIALMLIASFFPSVDRRLRRNRTLRSFLESADGFGDLSIVKKIRYGGLLCLRAFVDAIAVLVCGVSKLLSCAAVKYQAYR